MKTQKLLVWLSVKFSTIFMVLSLTLMIMSYQYRVSENNFPLISMMSAIVAITLIRRFNNVDDSVYMNIFRIDENDCKELIFIRGKSLWICVLIGAICNFFFASATINTPFSKDETISVINGKKEVHFRVINPFTFSKK